MALFYEPPTNNHTPFLAYWQLPIGLFIIPWAIFILIGTSNAVNLTDGLDGLAISSLFLNFGLFSSIAATGVVNNHELALIGAACAGASFGFFWYNSYPARMFMGDVGSLSLGATLALLALMARIEIILALSGVIFVVETVSVILQIASFKLFKRKLFKMAPLHHHFELIGWHESKITRCFMAITLIACLASLLLIIF